MGRHVCKFVVCLFLTACAHWPFGAPSPADSGTVKIKFIAFNDFHGYLKTPTDGVAVPNPAAPSNPTTVAAGGVAYMASQVASLKGENQNSVVVAAGDLIGASPLISSAFHDEPTIEAMNLLGLDLAGVGNHEFDKGKAELLRMQNGGCHPASGCRPGAPFEGARFKYLAANVIETATGKTFFPPYATRIVGGVKVAFIGIVLKGTPDVASSPAAIAGLEFRDEADTVNALIPELRSLGVAVIVVLIHEGGYTTGFFDECPGFTGPIIDITRRLDKAIDLVLSAHTHRAYNCQLEGRPVTSAGAYGRVVTDVDVVVDKKANRAVSVTARNLVIDSKTLPPEPSQAALVAKYDALVAPIANEIVGRISDDFGTQVNAAGESPVGKLIADAQLEATKGAPASAQVAFMNPGGIRAPLKKNPSGDVIYDNVFSVQPFGNSLITMTLTGGQLKQLLELQWINQPRTQLILQVSRGFEYAWDDTRQPGDRVDAASMKLNGVPISATTAYRVTVNSFLSFGGDHFPILKDGAERVEFVDDAKALVQFLRAHSPLAPDTRPRITKKGSP